MLNINLIKMEGFSSGHEHTYRETIRVAGLVMNSEEFKEMVINFKYQGSSGRFFTRVPVIVTKFLNTADTNEEVYRKFMSGFDDKSGIDHEIDVIAIAYHKNNMVLGSAMVGPKADNYVKWNTKFFGPIDSMVKTFVHEYSHRIGYGHSYMASDTRKYSAPYSLGHIAQDLAKLELSGNKLTPIKENPILKKLELVKHLG